MEAVTKEHLDQAIHCVISQTDNIEQLYPVQEQLIEALVMKENIFFTSATNSGKTLPVAMYPLILDELQKLGYKVSTGKVLFTTALNSIKMSMISNLRKFGIVCEALTSENYHHVLAATEIKVVFVSPEVLKNPLVSRALLAHRNSFVLKCVDEAHLGNYELFYLELKNIDPLI